MLTLIDGPCKGTYMCKRAPTFLRAVKGLDNAGKCDALDQVDDTPNSGEKVYVYELQGEVSTVHLNFGGGRGGFYAMASYHYLPDVDGEQLRDNATWQAWALAHVVGRIACPADGQECDKQLKACCSCSRNKGERSEELDDEPEDEGGHPICFGDYNCGSEQCDWCPVEQECGKASRKL